eukprot:NODE_217_length_12479_cov_0.651212.p4 type:complete len:397 gc:universal NODE_217_length_12479_cov_0.651212:3851-2661(-)
MNIVGYSSSEEEQQQSNQFVNMNPKLYNLMQRNKKREIEQEIMIDTIKSEKVQVSKQNITPGSEQYIKHFDVPVLELPKSEYHFKPVGNEQVCTLPRKCIFTYKGHKKGVNCSRFIPNYGHIFASASMDCTIKLWEIYKERQCLITIAGHNKGVRDVNWSHTGNKIVSASFDKYVKIFDISKEKSIFTWTIDRIPYVAKFHPQKENLLLVGCSDRKIYQIDVRANEIIHTYAEHKGQINSLTFLDEGNRFVSSADDKTMRVFEFDVPLAISYQSEPGLNSISNIVVHPEGNWMLCQSFSNNILVYGTKDKFRISKKRVFSGHDIAGYGCNINVSPDGKFILSGDSHGKLFFWSWKTQKVVSQLKQHNDVVMDCAWHPQESSKVLTASWDKTLKLWE